MKTIILAVAMVSLLGAGLPAQAQLREAVAEIRGCTDPTITGRARLYGNPLQGRGQAGHCGACSQRIAQ